MRRKDKEISDMLEIEDIICRAKVCRLGLADNNVPYVVPLSFGYEKNCLYLHSAKEGRKVEILKRNNTVCFEFEGKVTLVQDVTPCKWGFAYESVIGTGRAFFVDNLKEKVEALQLILSQYDAKKTLEATESFVKGVAVIKVEIDEMAGKRSPGIGNSES